MLVKSLTFQNMEFDSDLKCRQLSQIGNYK